MKLFTCTHCGQLLYFENDHCEQCGLPLGFLANSLQLFPLQEQPDGTLRLADKKLKTQYRYCVNRQYNACNWLVPAGSDSPYCRACELNHTIPDLTHPEYIERWRYIEISKHRLVYSLLRMQLPLVSKTTDPDKGIYFDFMADKETGEKEKILTGHNNGLITINIAEADDIEREMTRKAMSEVYRTVLGHFRHEIGHYYWDRLIADTGKQEQFRQVFGDETVDYAAALQQHYQDGAPADWNQHFISAYASTHPWEDWAETWSHYMHIIDTLETAYAFGLKVKPGAATPSPGLAAEMKADPYTIENFDTLMQLWLPLTFALNSLNRSMGLRDPYPFIINTAVKEKLSFIHHITRNAVRLTQNA